MPALPDARLETFASLLAAGMQQAPAARAAGYSVLTASVKSGKMAGRIDVARRVAELRDNSTMRPQIPSQPSLSLQAVHALARPFVQEPSQATSAVSFPTAASKVPASFQPAPPHQVAQAPALSAASSPPPPQSTPVIEPPIPIPRIDLARADREAVKRWSLTVLEALVHEAHAAGDRRVIASALSEVSKLSGTYAPQRIDAVNVSVLDGMSRAELLALVQVFETGRVLPDGSVEIEIDGEAEDITDAEEEAECDPLA